MSRKISKLFRVWCKRSGKYLSLGGYAKRTSWKNFAAATMAARIEAEGRIKTKSGGADDLEVHEFRIEVEPSVVHRFTL